MKETYDTSLLSELSPGVSLSKNTEPSFLNNLGKTVSKIVQFMRNRTTSVSMDHHLLAGGTLMSDESMVNSLSDFSQKARTNEPQDTSVMYAFDLEEIDFSNQHFK